MANCCGELLNCNELATIGYMRELVNMSPVSSCTHVSAGTVVAGCCTNVESYYAPKYSELTGGTFARKRVLDNSNPANDVNGFTYVTPTLVNSNCCNVNLQNEALIKSQVAFECTIALDNTLNVNTAPTYCDLDYSVTEDRTYKRNRYSCNGNNVESSTTTVSTSQTHSGELTRTVNGDNTSWTVSFDSVVITGATEAECNFVTSSTSVTLSDYSYGFMLEGVSNMPCNGGSIDVLTVDGDFKCDDDLSIEISTDFGKSTEWRVGDSNTVIINVPRNDYGQNTGTITITPIVWGSEYGESTITFSWDTCGLSPKATVNGCGCFDVEFVWEDDTNLIVHEY